MRDSASLPEVAPAAALVGEGRAFGAKESDSRALGRVRADVLKAGIAAGIGPRPAPASAMVGERDALCGANEADGRADFGALGDVCLARGAVRAGSPRSDANATTVGTASFGIAVIGGIVDALVSFGTGKRCDASAELPVERVDGFGHVRGACAVIVTDVAGKKRQGDREKDATSDGWHVEVLLEVRLQHLS